MTTVGKTLVGLTVAGLLAAGPAFASPEVDKELAEMREAVEGLKQKVEAQEEQLEHQGDLLEDAQKVVRDQQQEDGTLSGVGEFWQAVDVNMSVASSYAWNFRQPGDGFLPGANANIGQSGGFYPFHPDHNSFQVDQVWIDIGKDPTDESRAGFQFSILYGAIASAIGQGSPSFARFGTIDQTSDYYVAQAYVSYLAPLGEGVRVDAGKFATLLGAETPDTTKNWNITRGNLWNLLQSIDHLGVLTSTNIGPISLAAGVVNENAFFVSSPDVNKEKSYLGKIGIGNDTVNVAANVLYGAEGFTGARFNSPRSGLLDLLGTFNSDAFSAWINGDYAWVEGSRQAAWGIAVAGKVPITDAFSAALRLEYLRDKEARGAGGATGDFFGILGDLDGDGVFEAGEGLPRHSEIYGITGTLAYLLAENLTLKGEVRWDRVVENSGSANEEFFTKEFKHGDNDQVVGLAQLIYAF